eukprot:COSAG02_NODE_14992_length_1217_cov_0.695886_2_plen_98_part_00
MLIEYVGKYNAELLSLLTLVQQAVRALVAKLSQFKCSAAADHLASRDDAAGLDGGNPLLVVVGAVSLDADGTFPRLACAWLHPRRLVPLLKRRHRLL